MAVGAYILTHAPSGFFYVGSSNKLESRMREHQYALAGNKHKNKKLSQAYTRWEDFSYEFFVTDCREEAYDLEQQMLDIHLENPLCCNQATSVSNPLEGVITAEVRSRILERLKGHKWNLGRKRSSETKAKIGAASLGRTKSPEVRRKIAEAKHKRVSIDGVVYESIKAAAEKLNLTRSAVVSRLKSKHRSTWIYAE